MQNNYATKFTQREQEWKQNVKKLLPYGVIPTINEVMSQCSDINITLQG